jgi:AraC family transcriptional regulator of arabinose operon
MYYSAYNIPETNDFGTENSTEYLQVNCLGYYEFENIGHERYRKYGRNDFLLIYNHVGKAVARSNGIDYDIGNGTIVLFHPREEHYYKLSEEGQVKSFWIHFTGYGALSILQKLKIADKNIYTIGQNDEIPTITRIARNEIQERRIGFELYTSSLLMQLLTLVSRKYLNSGFSSKLLENSNKLDLSINYLHSNYKKNITVSELADLAGFCVSRYINLFKKITGSTPKDYLIKFRLQKSKELMRDTNLTLRQISFIVGFEDQLYFSRVFKKYEGVCPSQCRYNESL